jgi:hypothetical protein
MIKTAIILLAIVLIYANSIDCTVTGGGGGKSLEYEELSNRSSNKKTTQKNNKITNPPKVPSTPRTNNGPINTNKELTIKTFSDNKRRCLGNICPGKEKNYVLFITPSLISMHTAVCGSNLYDCKCEDILQQYPVLQTNLTLLQLSCSQCKSWTANGFNGVLEEDDLEEF